MSLLLFVLTGAAVAASRPPDNASSIPTRQVSALVGRYADWIVRNELRSAHEAIFRHVSDLDIDEHYPQLVQDNCVPMALGDYVSVNFNAGQLREAVVEALVRREFAKVPPPILDGVFGLWHRGDPALQPRHALVGVRAAADNERARVSPYINRFGECAVRADRAVANALILTEADADQEAAALIGLRTALGTCLAEAKSHNFVKAALGGTIAVNYSGLGVAARSTASAGTPE